MNTIREIQNLNKRELENGVSPAASWHADYRDTAYIYIGGLPFDLSEGDILTIFSQFGEPTYINLIRDRESGKSKGFAFLKYEDQRSTDLAVDNLGGAGVLGRVLKVDHTRYKRKDGEEGEDEERERGLQGGPAAGEGESEGESEGEGRMLLKEEVELKKLLRDHDDEDPMKDYLVKEKREEVVRARAGLEGGGAEGKKIKKEHEHKHKRHHHRHHQSHRYDHREMRRSGVDGVKDDRRGSGHGDRHRRSHRRNSRSP